MSRAVGKKITKKKTPTRKRTTKKPPTRKRTTKKPPTKAEARPNVKQDNVVSGKKPSERARAQTSFPGMTVTHDANLTQLADTLYDARTERLRLGKLEQEAAAKLLAEMRVKKLETYIDVELGLRVEVVATDFKVKVKKYDPDDE